MLGRETDAAFVARLLSEEGWNWCLVHTDDGKPLSEAKAAKHCLVISDAQAKRPDLGALRFGKPDVRRSLAKAGLPEALRQFVLQLPADYRHRQLSNQADIIWGERAFSAQRTTSLNEVSKSPRRM
jgi:hypothetical protein